MTVDVRAEQGRARLRVRDTGIGIAAEDQPRVFDRFFRADPARTHTAGQGTGLGLCIVAEMVAAHEGSVQVTSTPGEGTTFTVELPLAESPGKPAAEPPATASSTQEQE